MDVEFESGDAIGNGITVARGLFCGAQSGILAYGRNIGWKEKVFEYDSQFGVEVASVSDQASESEKASVRMEIKIEYIIKGVDETKAEVKSK